MQSADNCLRAFKVRVGNPHGQNILIETIPFDTFRMTAVNYAIKVHLFLLSAILNPSRTKWYSRRKLNGKIEVKKFRPGTAAPDIMPRF